jgi:hypothetical protein
MKSIERKIVIELNEERNTHLEWNLDEFWLRSLDNPGWDDRPWGVSESYIKKF